MENITYFRLGKFETRNCAKPLKHVFLLSIDKIDTQNCNTMCPYVCCVYCPDPVWIPSVHACVDLSFVSSRLNIRNVLSIDFYGSQVVKS